MLEDEEHITEDFRLFIDRCLSDYLYEKQMNYAIGFALRFNKEWFSEKALKEIMNIHQRIIKRNGKD